MEHGKASYPCLNTRDMTSIRTLFFYFFFEQRCCSSNGRCSKQRATVLYGTLNKDLSIFADSIDVQRADSMRGYSDVQSTGINSGDDSS